MIKGVSILNFADPIRFLNWSIRYNQSDSSFWTKLHYSRKRHSVLYICMQGMLGNNIRNVEKKTLVFGIFLVSNVITQKT